MISLNNKEKIIFLIDLYNSSGHDLMEKSNYFKGHYKHYLVKQSKFYLKMCDLLMLELYNLKINDKIIM